MTNAELDLDGTKLTLRVSFKGLMTLKQQTGVDLLQSGHGQRLTEADVLPVAIWAFSDAEKRGMTVEQIAELMDVRKTVEYINVLQELIAPDPTGPSDQDAVVVEAATP